MIIKETDFILTSITDISPKFDLELLHTIKPKGGEQREEFKLVAYALPLDSAIQRIVQYRISKKYQEEAISMKIYLEEYKRILQEIKDLCYGEVKESNRVIS